MTNKNAPARQSAGHTTHTRNNSRAQRTRILAALQAAPISTFDARKKLDIPHPAARVMELRKTGYPIVTHWCDALSEAGLKHRVAQYVLLSERQLSLALR